mgnify:CR=1 FL=1
MASCFARVDRGLRLDSGFFILMAVSFVLGAGAGFVMHRSDFCLAGALRDLFLFRSAARLRPLLLAIVVSMVLFSVARRLGLLLYPFPLLGSPSLANLVGGFLFGVGMVLAGGCVVGTLYKLGAGSRPALLALAGMVAGSGLYAEIHPWWSALAKRTAFLAGQVTLPQALGISDAACLLPLVAGFVWLSWRWQRRRLWHLRAHAEGYLQPWRAALVLAAIGLLSAVTVGMPLGVTTSYAKAAAWMESQLLPDHVAGLAFYAARPLDYLSPLGGVRLLGGAGPQFDGIAAVQVPLIGGIVLGAGWSAVRLGEWRPAGRLPRRQAVAVVAGGVLMGLASRLAPGCNVWHLLGGVPILALPSLLFTAALLPGTWVGCRLLLAVVMVEDSTKSTK